MNVQYEAFLPYVLPAAPHIPEPTAVLAIRNACIDFCRGTLLLEQEMDPISVAAGVADYEIDVLSGTMLAHVVSLYYQGMKLPKRTMSELAVLYTRDWMNMSGTPKYYTQLNPTEVKLVLTPEESVAEALTGVVAISPTRTSSTVDSQLFDRYAEQIARGALAKLLVYPGQTATDTNGAMVYQRQFQSDIANVRAAVNAGQTRAPMKVRFTRT